MAKKMTLKRLRSISIFWSLFIGIGALWGSMMMFIDPSGKMWGMDLILPYLQVFPFSNIFFKNFIPSGIVLLCVNGITNFISFLLMLKNHHYAASSAMCCGIILMLWITVQFVIFPLNFMSTIYFFFGLLQAWTGYEYWKKENINLKHKPIH